MSLFDHLLLPSPINGYYQTLTHSASVELIGKKPGNFASLDTETVDGVPFMVTSCDSQGRVFSWSSPVNPKTRKPGWTDRQLHQIRSHCQSYDSIIFHNSKYDLACLARLDIQFGNHIKTFHDTLAASHVCNSIESHGLKDLSVKYLDFPDSDESVLRERVKHLRAKYRHSTTVTIGDSVGSDYWLPFYEKDPICLEYACNDAIRTSLLWHLYHQVLTSEKLLPQYLRELVLIPIILRMESNGITILKSRHSTVSKSVLEKVDHMTKQCQSLSNNPDLNLNSPKQLIEVLYNTFSLPVLKRSDTGQPSTDVATIHSLQDTLEQDRSHYRENKDGRVTFTSRAYDFLTSLIAHRKADTARKYLSNYSDYGTLEPNYIRLHPSYNPWGTNTTRFSSSEPNAQNISKKAEDGDINLRSIFGPTKDHVWYSIDYNQLELRIMAQASGDKILLKVLSDGLDMHQYTADRFRISRKQGKIINFAWQYGASNNKLSRLAGVSAEEFSKSMKLAYPGVMDFMSSTIADARSTGHVHTLMGYRLCVEREAPYKGTNYIIQGTAGDCTKNAMIACEGLILRSKHRSTSMILTIHDELVFNHNVSSPSHLIQEIRDAMSASGPLFNCPTPTSLSIIRDNWGSPEELPNESPSNDKPKRSTPTKPRKRLSSRTTRSRTRR